MFNERDQLKQYFGQRVMAQGVFDGSDIRTYYHSLRENRVCLVQDVVLSTGEKDMYIGHVWVQQANAIKNMNPVRGDRIRFSARVSRYHRKRSVASSDGLTVECRYGLENPADIEFMKETLPVVPFGGKDVSLASLPDLPAIMRSVKGLVEQVGGDAIERLLPHLDKINETACLVGGSDKLREMVEMFS
jgi:hypothetical protein